MSLRAFHVVFVSCSVLLAFVFGGWALHASGAGRGAIYLALGLGSFLAGLALLVYGVWFWRKIRTPEQERERRRRGFHSVPLGLLVCALAPRAAEACSVCYGEATGPMIDAARLGVWLLFGMVLLVQAAFVAFFVALWRRARRYRASHAEIRWVD